MSDNNPYAFNALNPSGKNYIGKTYNFNRLVLIFLGSFIKILLMP